MIDRDGLHETSEKIDVVKALSPINVSQLRSFLDLVNYYGKFVLDLATVLRPFHQKCLVSHCIVTAHDQFNSIMLFTMAALFTVYYVFVLNRANTTLTNQKMEFTA